MEESFRKVFSILDRNSFLQSPESILSYMRDVGFQKPVVKLMEMVIGVEWRRFLMLMTCPQEEMDDQIHIIAENCFLNETVLEDVINDLRSALDSIVATRIIDHPMYGKCRLTSDGIALFSEDLTKLLHVDENMTSFVIPGSVTQIGDGAFENCDNLVNIVIPNSVTEIGNFAFHNCSSLETIVLPNSIGEIGSWAFGNCVNLRCVEIPNSTYKILPFAFEGCCSLSSVIVPSGLDIVNVFSFSINLTIILKDKDGNSLELDLDGDPDQYRWFICGLAGFNEDLSELLWVDEDVVTLDIPRFVKEVKSNAFAGCSCLESVTIPDADVMIGVSAFSECYSLREVIVPQGVDLVEAFEYCYFDHDCSIIISNNQSVDVESYRSNYDGVAIFNDDYTILKEVIHDVRTFEVPSTVTQIRPCAFSHCKSLEKLVIPENIIIMEETTFAGLINAEIHIGTSDISKTGRYCVKDGSVFESTLGPYSCDVLYSGYGLVKDGNCIIPNTVKRVGRNALEGCTSVVKLIVPESVDSIGDNAFSDCKKLEFVILPESLTDLGSESFHNCSQIKDIIVPGDVQYMGQKIFAGCWRATLHVKKYKSFRIKYRVFNNCLFEMHINTIWPTTPKSWREITSISNKECRILFGYGLVKNGICMIPAIVTRVEEEAFLDCISLKTLVVPQSVTYISARAFAGCSRLEEIIICNPDITINEESFIGCNSLKRVIIPRGFNDKCSLPNGIKFITIDNPVYD